MKPTYNLFYYPPDSYFVARTDFPDLEYEGIHWSRIIHQIGISITFKINQLNTNLSYLSSKL